MKFGISSEHFKLLSDLLFVPLHRQGASVWIFGSRAKGTHKKFSDVDVLYEVDKKKPFPPGFLSQIREQLEESRLPYKVDLVCLDDLAQSYRDDVLNTRVRIEPY